MTGNANGARKRRVLPPVWLLIAILATWALDRWMPLATVLQAPWHLLGIAPIVLGMLMSVFSAGAFKRAGTPVIPFEPSTALVTRGWFRVSRNPMYLGLALVLAGIALINGTVGALLPLPVFIAILHWRFIRGEERFLEEIFGDDYRAYRARVRRWL